MRYFASLTLVSALLLAAGCDSTGSNGRILLQDDCDPATFNAALGAGTCDHRSAAGVTFANFNAELQATHNVAAWRIFPPAMTIAEGEGFDVENTGGETHTYTEVDEFGGGVVPALNAAAGLATVAPECQDGAVFAASTIRSGQTQHHTFDEAGTEKYQCCIHPWMRQTVTVQ